MKGQAASLLIAVALIVGIGIGYFGNTATQSPGQTVLMTYTITTTLPAASYTITTSLGGYSGTVQCIVTEYHVWEVEEYPGNSMSTSTQSYPVLTFQTTASVEQTAGFETTTTARFTGTLTGAIALWNSTVCTFVSG